MSKKIVLRKSLSLVMSFIMGALTAFVGSFLYRSGVEASIPWGLICSLLLIGLCAWIARDKAGRIGVGVTLFSTGLTVILLTVFAFPTGNILLVNIQGTWWTQNLNQLWQYGFLVIQLIIFALPSRWFSASRSTTGNKRDGKEDNRTRDSNEGFPSS